jgi:hypothetical protein
MIEIWKKANGYSNYEVSSLGRLKTYNWKGTKKEAILKPALDKSGYLRTVLKSDEGISKTIKVHRVVLNTFNPILEVMEVNHINGIKNDNRIENLEWVTRQQNIQHCIDNNLQYVLKGEEIGNSKLTEIDVIYIRANFKPRIITRNYLAKKFNVTEATIKDILQKRTWKHLL